MEMEEENVLKKKNEENLLSKHHKYEFCVKEEPESWNIVTDERISVLENGLEDSRYENMKSHKQTAFDVNKTSDQWDSPKIKSLKFSPTNKLLTCSFCLKTFRQPCRRVQHEMTHTGEKPYACDYCPKTFILSYRRDAHQRTHTPADKKRLKDSKEVKVSTHQVAALLVNEKSAGGNLVEQWMSANSKRPSAVTPPLLNGASIKCSFCPKTFVYPQSRIKHERIHTNRSYLCKYCPKRFTCMSKKVSHQRYHAGVRMLFNEVKEEDNEPQL